MAYWIRACVNDAILLERTKVSFTKLSAKIIIIQPSMRASSPSLARKARMTLKIKFFLLENKGNIAKKGRESRAKCSSTPRPDTHTHFIFIRMWDKENHLRPLLILKLRPPIHWAMLLLLSYGEIYGQQRHFKLTRFLCDSRSEYCSEQQCEDGTLW